MLVLSLIILVQHNSFASLISEALAVQPHFGDITQPWMSYFGLFLAFLWFGIVSPSAVMRNFASRIARPAGRTAAGYCSSFLLCFVLGLLFVSVVERYGFYYCLYIMMCI